MIPPRKIERIQMLQTVWNSVRNLFGTEERTTVTPVETLVLSYDKHAWGNYKTLKEREEMAQAAASQSVSR